MAENLRDRTAGLSGDFDVAVHDTIRAVDREAWDALAGDNVLAAHGWLLTVEATLAAPLRPKYFVTRHLGRLVAGAAGYHVPLTDTVETLDSLVLGRLRPGLVRLGVSLLPTFVIGPLAAYGCHLLVAPDLPPEAGEALCLVLLDAIEAESAGAGVAPAFVNVLATQPALIRSLEKRGYFLLRGVPLNILEVVWDSFEGYLHHLDTVSRGARKDIRRQINRNRKRGTEITKLEDPRPHARRLHELLDLNSRRHNKTPFPFQPDFFGALRENLGEDAVIHVARKAGSITAVGVMLRRGTTAALPMVGVDHDLAGNDFTYFNIAHFRPIEEAIAGRIRRMIFGRALYELKARRGCKVVDTFTAYRPSGRLTRALVRFWFPCLSAWNRAKLPARVRHAGKRTPA